MPLYPFTSVDDPRKSTDLFFSMNDAPSIGSVYTNENGVKWKRALSKPYAAIDTQIDPYSAKDFVKVTSKGGGVVGDLWDRSAELSAKRADKEGQDPVRAKFYKDYAKK